MAQIAFKLMLFLVIFLFHLSSATCNPGCEDQDCIQVGENTFSCLPRGTATLFPATNRRVLDLCQGCDFHSIVEVPTPSGTLIKKQQSYFGIPIVGSHIIELRNDADEILHVNGQILDVGDDLPNITPAQDLQLLIQPYKCEEMQSKLAITFINFKAHLIWDVKCWTDLADETVIGHMWNIEFDAHNGTVLIIFDGVDSVDLPNDPDGNCVDTFPSCDVVVSIGDCSRMGDECARSCGRCSTSDPDTSAPVTTTIATSTEMTTSEALNRSSTTLPEATKFDALGGNDRAGAYQHQFQLVRNGDDCTYDSEHVYVANNQGSSTQSNEEPWTFPCSLLPEQNDAVNGAASPLNDAFAFGLTFWNLYQEWYDMPPLSEKLGLVVHYGEGYAMWDGRKMYFSDGDSWSYHPFVSVDVVAHEVSHGTTQHNSGLVYRDQSGGINEAFSDMAGATAEFFYFNTTEFEIGNKVLKQSGAMRYMCDPERDGLSIGHVDNYRHGMDVHASSGVFNKVFCTLSNKPEWDPRKAFHVFLVANRVYWDRNTNFEDGANDAIQASVDLGYGSDDICEAFSQVGIVGSGCNCVDTFPSCDSVVRIGYCSRMGDECARSCGRCSDYTTVAATTSEATTSTSDPDTSAPVTTTIATSTEMTTSEAPNRSSTTLPEATKVIMIISDVPYSCDVQQLSQASDGSFSFQQGDCMVS